MNPIEVIITPRITTRISYAVSLSASADANDSEVSRQLQEAYQQYLSSQAEPPTVARSPTGTSNEARFRKV